MKTTALFLVIAVIFVIAVFKGGDLFKAKDSTSNVQATAPTKTSAEYLSQIESLSLRDYKGEKITAQKADLEAPERLVIHFWASWCAPCVNEVPELMSYAKKHQDVKFLVVAVDDYQDDITKFLKSFPDFDSSRYMRVWDGDKKLAKLFDVDRLPMSVVFEKGHTDPQFYRAVVDWKNLN